MSQDKWEEWALGLHDKAADLKGNFQDDSSGDHDQQQVMKIFNARDKVSQVLRLRPANEAWSELKRHLSPGNRWMEVIKYAAVFIASILISGTAFWTYYADQSPDEYTTVTSPNGQISNITLFDGTNIWLNAGSSLKYSRAFNKSNREIFLDGEAFFSVIKNGNKPFVVHAGDAQVKVYGTEFNLKAYGNETQIETVLIEGKVQVTSSGGDVVMKPGERLILSRTTGKSLINQVNPEEYTSWKGGKIYFNNETLQNLILQLERWYEVKFTFAHEHLKSYRFSGVINKDKTLNYTLRIIQEINKVQFEMKDEQILIKDK